MNWKPWLKGIVAALIGGGSNAIVARFTDPATYTDIARMMEFAAWGAVINVAMYLARSPFPPDVVTETTIKRVEGPHEPVTTTTVKETRTEPEAAN